MWAVKWGEYILDLLKHTSFIVSLFSTPCQNGGEKNPIVFHDCLSMVADIKLRLSKEPHSTDHTI